MIKINSFLTFYILIIVTVIIISALIFKPSFEQFGGLTILLTSLGFSIKYILDWEFKKSEQRYKLLFEHKYKYVVYFLNEYSKTEISVLDMNFLVLKYGNKNIRGNDKAEEWKKHREQWMTFRAKYRIVKLFFSEDTKQKIDFLYNLIDEIDNNIRIDDPNHTAISMKIENLQQKLVDLEKASNNEFA